MYNCAGAISLKKVVFIGLKGRTCMKSSQPGVGIILLNWNGYQDTYDCLKSLESLSYPNFKVYVVDNLSSDDSYARLLEDHHNGEFKIPVDLIQSGGNLGFAGGNNIGIQAAYESGLEYIWLLNNDTVVDPYALTSLVIEMEKDQKIGIIGSKIYYYNTNLIWFAGGEVNEWFGSVNHPGLREKDEGQFNQLREVDFITGCSLLLRKELIETVGYMREDYFLYYEETDWNVRARQTGWKIVYCPQSIVYHKVSLSSGGEKNISPYVDYYDIRNGFHLILNTYGWSRVPTAFSSMIWKSVKKTLKIILKYNNKGKRIHYLFMGIWDGCRLKRGKHPVL